MLVEELADQRNPGNEHRVGGRKHRMTNSKVATARILLKAGAAPKDVAHDLGVPVPTLYRRLPATSRSQLPSKHEKRFGACVFMID